MRLTVENFLMIVGKMHIANQRVVLKRIQKVNDLLNSFIIKQVIPYLGVWLVLINNESSNHLGQPKMGSTFTFEWRISIQ